MKTLFNVVVVSKEEEILLDKKVVASDEEEALFLAGVAEVLKEKNKLPKDVTMKALVLCDVKVEKEPQKVRIIKDE